MEIPNTFAPLVVSAIRDAVLYQEGLLRSETIRDKTDFEEHHLQLTQLLAFVKDEYKKIEAELGLPLDKIL